MLLDVHMREKDGFQVLQEIMSHNGTSHVPVLMITADDSADHEHRRRACRATSHSQGRYLDATRLLLDVPPPP